MCLQKETLQQEVWQQTQPVAQTLQGTILLQMQSSYAVVLHPCAGMQVLQSQQIHPAECVLCVANVVIPFVLHVVRQCIATQQKNLQQRQHHASVTTTAPLFLVQANKMQVFLARG